MYAIMMYFLIIYYSQIALTDKKQKNPDNLTVSESLMLSCLYPYFFWLQR